MAATPGGDQYVKTPGWTRDCVQLLPLIRKGMKVALRVVRQGLAVKGNARTVADDVSGPIRVPSRPTIAAGRALSRQSRGYPTFPTAGRLHNGPATQCTPNAHHDGGRRCRSGSWHHDRTSPLNATAQCCKCSVRGSFLKSSYYFHFAREV